MTNPVNGIPDEDVEEFGIEYFDDYIKNQRPQGQPKPQEEKGFARRAFEGAADIGLFGPFMVGEEGRRHTGRTAARVGETLLGLPGDVREVTKFAGDWLGDKARGLLGKEPLTDEEKSFIEEQMKPSDWDLLGRLTEALPTSSELREGVTRKYTGDYLEPQNKWEAFADDVAQDFAALAIPVKGKIPFARALGSSLVANTGGEIAGEFLGEDAKNYTKLGLLFATGMVGRNKGGVKKYINELYTDMRSEVPEGARVASSGLESKLKKIEAQLRKGDPSAASKKEAFQKIDAIRNKVQGGEITVDELLELTKDTNEVIFSGKELVRSQNKLFDIREALHDATKEYGSQNAEFLSKWKDANQAYAATELSRKVGNWVKKNIKPKDYAYAATALGVEGGLLGAPAALTTMGGLGGAAATAYSAEVMKRIAQSPALRRYYMNTVNASLKQNKAGFTRNIKMLDDGLNKSFQESPFDTVDFSEEEIEEQQ